MKLLEVRGLTKRFGGLVANDSVDLECDSGQIVGLIGPNGAGKTTLFNCVNGYFPPNGGQIWFAEGQITGWSPDRVCRQGVARTFQIVQVVDTLTVLENVMIGAFCRHSRTSAARMAAEKALDEIGLGELAPRVTSSLTLAQKRRVEIARAIATEPKLLLLDEPMGGLNVTEVREMVGRVCKLRDRGMGILWVEHVMEAIMPVADYMVVLDFGKKISAGVPVEVAKDPKVIDAYLGGESHVAV